MTSSTTQVQIDGPKAALEKAIKNGDIAKVKTLLSADSALAGLIYDNKQTTLHIAAALQDKRIACELCKILIRNGADPTIVDANKAKALDKLPPNFKGQALTEYNNYRLSKRQADSKSSPTNTEDTSRVATTKKDRDYDRRLDRQMRIEINDLCPIYISRINQLTNEMIRLTDHLNDIVSKFNKNTDKKEDIVLAKEIYETTQRIYEIVMQRLELQNLFKDLKDRYPAECQIFDNDLIIIPNEQNKKFKVYINIINEVGNTPREKELLDQLRTIKEGSFDKKFAEDNRSLQDTKTRLISTGETFSTSRQALQDITSLNKTFIKPGGIKELLKIINTPYASEEWKLHKMMEIAAKRAQQSGKFENGRSPLLHEFYLRLANAETNPEALKTRSLDRAKNQITAVQMIREIFSTQSAGETLRAINAILQKTDITIDRKLADIENKLSSRLSKKNLDPKHEALYTQLLAYVKETKTGIVPDLKSGKFNALHNEARQKTAEASLESIGLNIRRRS